MSEDHAIMSDWYRKLALILMTTLIISAAGQWIVWVKWSARIDERHIYYDAALTALQLRGLAAVNAGPRISVLENQIVFQNARLVNILDNIQRINDKLDRAIARDSVELDMPTRPGQN